MFERLTRRISRPTWAAIAIIAVLALSMAFPSVRAAAGNLLQMFRVEQVRIIPVDMRSLPGDLDSSEQLQAMFTDHVEIEERGEHRTVADADEAAALAGFNLRLPADLTGDTAIVYQPGGVATFTLDLELARGVLREMGRTDIELPDTLDGAKARIDIPDSVAINRGDCRQPSKDEATEFDSSQKAEPRDCLTLLQMPSPSISAPPNLNLEELGKIYLQVLGLNDKEAELFARTVDWTTTFVIPVPVGSASYEEVQVDGVAGTLISERSRQRTTVLLWVKDGTIYVLEGANSKAEALRIANSLQ